MIQFIHYQSQIIEGFLERNFEEFSIQLHNFDWPIKGTVTRFCACAASWFLVWRTFFHDWPLVKKSSSIDPETSENAIISVFKSYLFHFRSFKRHILFLCGRCRENQKSLRRSARRHIIRCQCSYKRICLLSSPVNDLPFSVRF